MIAWALFVSLAAVPTTAPASRPAVSDRVIEGLMGRLAADHPRLVFRPTAERNARTFDEVRRTFAGNATFRQLFQPVLDARNDSCDAVTLASKWIATGDDTYARLAIQDLAQATLETTAESKYYSDVWCYALAYDWLYNHPAMTDAVRTHVEDEVGRVVEKELADLDSDGPAMWHGRNQYANDTLVAVLALSRHARREEFLRRALWHYIITARAIKFVEAWPEGAMYWIYNRAVPFPLAADCVRTALGTDTVDDVNLVDALRATGYWQAYQTQPDLSIACFGDGDAALTNRGQPWMDSIDYFARYTRDPGLIAFADRVRPALMKTAYRPGREGWDLVLAYDPDLAMPKDYDPKKPAEYLDRHVPTARLFGRDTTGIAYFRSSWSDTAATAIAFKAGDCLAHHGHYDQGTFTIFKRGAVAPLSGAYRGYTSSHRLGYYIQTVAANSLLILEPGEFSNYLRSRKAFDALSGGQRVVMATGSDITSVDHWLANRTQGLHYKAADIVAWQSVPGDYDYVAADLTAAYNSTRWAEPGNRPKVSEVTRHLLYLHAQDAVVVFDRVVSTDPAYRKRWLLHHRDKPVTEMEDVIQGEAENGIIETTDRRLTTTVGEAKLVHQVVLPMHARVYKIGGPDYAFYAEADGDGSHWAGRDLGFEGGRKPSPGTGLWRTEIEPAEPAAEDVFLNVLWPRAADDAEPEIAGLANNTGETVPLVLGDQTLVFFRHADRTAGKIVFTLVPRMKRVLILGAVPNAKYAVDVDKATPVVTASAEGVIAWAVPTGLSRRVTMEMQKT